MESRINWIVRIVNKIHSLSFWHGRFHLSAHGGGRFLSPTSPGTFVDQIED